MNIVVNFINTKLGYNITDADFAKFESVFPPIEVVVSAYVIEYKCHGEQIAYMPISTKEVEVTYEYPFYQRFGSLIKSLCEILIQAKINKLSSEVR